MSLFMRLLVYCRQLRVNIRETLKRRSDAKFSLIFKDSADSLAKSVALRPVFAGCVFPQHWAYDVLHRSFKLRWHDEQKLKNLSMLPNNPSKLAEKIVSKLLLY